MLGDRFEGGLKTCLKSGPRILQTFVPRRSANTLGTRSINDFVVLLLATAVTAIVIATAKDIANAESLADSDRNRRPGRRRWWW